MDEGAKRQALAGRYVCVVRGKSFRDPFKNGYAFLPCVLFGVFFRKIEKKSDLFVCGAYGECYSHTSGGNNAV
jgi:hypothetical protein